MRELASVAIGGLVGTGLRLGLDQLLPHDGRSFPISTFVINLVGSLLLGFLVARVWPVAPAWLRVGLGTGLLGSFTTFSALILSTLGLTHNGELLLALVYLVVSLFGGFGASLLGLRLGGDGRRSRAAAIDEVTE
jgi:CrcB protein